jgi:hypothetical protein
MALLTILFLLFGFAFLGLGSGSGGVSDYSKNSIHQAQGKCSKRMGADSKGCKPANP